MIYKGQEVSVPIMAPWMVVLFEEMADKLQVSMEEVLLAALALGADQMRKDGEAAFEAGVAMTER